MQRSRVISAVRRARCAGWLLSCAGLLLTLVARADPAAQARFHDELARNHYQAGRFEPALREFFLEQRISPNPRIAFNIALCFHELDRNEEAFQYFTEYLASEDADPERRAYAERVVTALRKSLALLSVQSSPPGADIYVDRRELGSYGRAPKTIALTPGEHQIWAELDGYRTGTGTIEARRSEDVTLNVALQRIVGQLTVRSPVPGRVTVRGPSGEALEQGPAPLRVSLPPGNYEIRVSSSGYLPWVGMARVEAEKAAQVDAVPQALPAATGNITVTSNVPGALVELNGEPVGFSPAVLPNVKVGSHRLHVGAPSVLPWSGTVDVAARERSWLTVTLEEPRTKRPSPATWIAGGIGASALVTGGVLAVFAAKTHQDFQNAPAGTERAALRERGMALNTAASAALITGAVAAMTAVVLYFTTREVRGRPSAASLARSKQ